MPLVLEQGRERLKLLLVGRLVAHYQPTLSISAPRPHVREVLVELMRDSLKGTLKNLVLGHRRFLNHGRENTELKLCISKQR